MDSSCCVGLVCVAGRVCGPLVGWRGARATMPGREPPMVVPGTTDAEPSQDGRRNVRRRRAPRAKPFRAAAALCAKQAMPGRPVATLEDRADRLRRSRPAPALSPSILADLGRQPSPGSVAMSSGFTASGVSAGGRCEGRGVGSRPAIEGACVVEEDWVAVEVSGGSERGVRWGGRRESRSFGRRSLRRHRDRWAARSRRRRGSASFDSRLMISGMARPPRMITLGVASMRASRRSPFEGAFGSGDLGFRSHDGEHGDLRVSPSV